MGILTSAVLSGGLSSRPLLHTEKCLNRVQKKYPCAVCTELCPQQVFSLDPKAELKWSRCIDCGLCVSSCPSRCFTPSAETQRVLTDGTRSGEAVVFACEQEEELLDRKLRCLAAVPWELMAALAFYCDVVLYLKHCPSCEKASWHACLQEHLEALRDFLGEEKFRRRIRLITSGTWTPETPEEEQVLSRRAIFSRTGRSLKKNLYYAAASRLPQLDASEQDALQYRRLLSQAVLAERERLRNGADGSGGEAAPLPVYTVSLPAYTPSCFGCGICERICPQKAIEIIAEAGDSRLIYITPWKCTACGLCARVCPHGGLRGMKKTAVPFLEQLPLARVSSASCERCGIAVPPGSSPRLCPACAAKAKKPGR